MDKAECRKAFGVPENLFLFGMIAANKEMPPRKSFQEAIDAFKLFHDKHPESAMYFNTLVQQQGGFDIPGYANFLGIGECIYSLDPYVQMYKIDRPTLAKIENMFDVLLCPSLNEGFGVPIIEAQACGVPAIVNNCTAMPELVIPGKTGEICEVAYKRWSPLAAYMGVPDHKSLYEQMEKIYAAGTQKYAKNARKFVVDNYDSETVIKDAWLPFLSVLEKEVYGEDKSTADAVGVVDEGSEVKPQVAP
jgi:glycosyltransferase involved in cell wall biosynthesis